MNSISSIEPNKTECFEIFMLSINSSVQHVSHGHNILVIFL